MNSNDLETALRDYVDRYLERLWLAGFPPEEIRTAHAWLNDFFRKAFDIGLLKYSIEPSIPTDTYAAN